MFQAAAFNAESEPIRVATIVKGRDTAQAYVEVLDHVSSVSLEFLDWDYEPLGGSKISGAET